jgi:hypothetical protein
MESKIQRINLGNLVLLLKSLGIDDPFTFHYMDSSPLDKLRLEMIKMNKQTLVIVWLNFHLIQYYQKLFLLVKHTNVQQKF